MARISISFWQYLVGGDQKFRGVKTEYRSGVWTTFAVESFGDDQSYLGMDPIFGMETGLTLAAPTRSTFLVTIPTVLRYGRVGTFSLG